MTTPQEVVGQAMQMVSGSKLEQARAGISALNLFSQLSADDKRQLAVLVAQRVAPNLVPRIEAETGMEMTAEQSRAVLDMVRRLDGDDLAEIQSSLGSPDARRATIGTVGAAAAAATGVDDVVARPTPQPRREATSAADRNESSEHQQARVRALEERVDQLTDDLGAAQTARSEAEARARTDETRIQSAEARAEDAERRAEDQARAAERARGEARQATDRVREAEDRARRLEAGRVAADDVVGRFTPVASGGTTWGGARGDVEQLVARLHEASASGALRMVVGSVPTLAAMDSQDRLRVIVTIADGWARRKAIQRLAEADALTPAEGPRLLATLGSVGNQVFAAASMLDAGLVTPDDLVDVLDPSALARLHRRTPVA